jgi:predicted MPP superfamily phosphohydrolase
MNKFTKFAVIAGILFVLFGTVSSYCLTVSHYELRAPEIRTSVRLLLITDLHSCLYGKNQVKLIQAIEAENPDALMFCGDIADDKRPIENLDGLLEAVGIKYPCFYVTGNHEYWSGEVENIKRFFRDYGVIVLEGEYRSLRVRGAEITVCGVDDPESGNFEPQLTAAARGMKAGVYSVLLSHRPELFPRYAARNFDLVLAGHAHGGLWRIPWILNGAVAPNQGFFPKYTSGQYLEQSATMILSRGLARESTLIPRFFNRVELVTIDLLPPEVSDSVPAEKTPK